MVGDGPLPENPLLVPLRGSVRSVLHPTPSVVEKRIEPFLGNPHGREQLVGKVGHRNSI